MFSRTRGPLKESPLLQQVGFEMFEIMTISNFTGQGENVFKSNTNWVKVIAYFRF